MKYIKREWALFGQPQGIVEMYNDEGKFKGAVGWRGNPLVRILN